MLAEHVGVESRVLKQSNKIFMHFLVCDKECTAESGLSTSSRFYYAKLNYGTDEKEKELSDLADLLGD